MWQKIPHKQATHELKLRGNLYVHNFFDVITPYIVLLYFPTYTNIVSICMRNILIIYLCVHVVLFIDYNTLSHEALFDHINDKC